MGQLESSWIGVVVSGDDGEWPSKEDSPWDIGLAIWFVRWWVIIGGDDGSVGFWMIFWITTVEDSINGIGRTFWIELES